LFKKRKGKKEKVGNLGRKNWEKGTGREVKEWVKNGRT
jgi:hypothetical protein